MSRPKKGAPRGRKWKRDQTAERAVQERRPTVDQGKAAGPAPATESEPAELAASDVIVPGPNWPCRAFLRDHAVYHRAPGAVPANRGRLCPRCHVVLWDPAGEANGPHTVEWCDRTVAYEEEQERRYDERSKDPYTMAIFGFYGRGF